MLIAVSGPSGSGKSTRVQELLAALSEQYCVNAIAEDNYYKCQDHLTFEERLSTNYDHPSAFDHELLIEHLAQLRRGQPVDVPEYCYHTHTRKSTSTHLPVPDILIIEGIMLLTNDGLREQFHHTVYIDVPQAVCLDRRIKRDVAHRGRTQTSVIEQYEQFVKPMFDEYVAPSQQYADLVLETNDRVDTLLAYIEPRLNNTL
jgi:uridine kinase